MAEKQRITWEEFAKQHPEYCVKPKKKTSDQMKFLCQCKFGHVFDYRERIRFPIENVHYAPCQGKCPYCGTTIFSFIGTALYPIKMNFTG